MIKADLPLLSAETNRSLGGPQPVLGSATHLCQSQQAHMACACRDVGFSSSDVCGQSLPPHFDLM